MKLSGYFTHAECVYYFILQNGYTPLHVAAKFGSINAANYLIDNGAELNTGAKVGLYSLLIHTL